MRRHPTQAAAPVHFFRKQLERRCRDPVASRRESVELLFGKLTSRANMRLTWKRFSRPVGFRGASAPQ